jgi:serine protease inhibitor
MEMNEKGTEAAASTIVKISKRSLPMEIRLNRPYIYFITESSTNLIVFIGSFNGLSEPSTDENMAEIKSEL